MKPICYSEIPLAPSLQNSLSEFVEVVYEEPKVDEYFVVESQQFFAYQFKYFFSQNTGSWKAVGFNKKSKIAFNQNYDFVDLDVESEGVEYLGLKRISTESNIKAFPILKDHLELKKTLFLDRDGVLMTDHGYVSEVDKVEVMDDVLPFLKKAKELDYQFVVLTNQSGIGRGYYTEEQMQSVHSYLNDWLNSHDIEVASWQFCPYHPEGQGNYQLKSFLRKPLPGMLMQAADQHGVEMEGSLMVGDKISDDLFFPDLKCVHILSNYDLEGANGKVYHSFQAMISELQ